MQSTLANSWHPTNHPYTRRNCEECGSQWGIGGWILPKAKFWVDLISARNKALLPPVPRDWLWLIFTSFVLTAARQSRLCSDADVDAVARQQSYSMNPMWLLSLTPYPRAAGSDWFGIDCDNEEGFLHQCQGVSGQGLCMCVMERGKLHQQ